MKNTQNTTPAPVLTPAQLAANIEKWLTDKNKRNAARVKAVKRADFNNNFNRVSFAYPLNWK